MNFQRLTSFFQRETKRKKPSTNKIDKWYEYSSMNDIYNPTLDRMRELKAKEKNTGKKKIGSA